MAEPKYEYIAGIFEFISDDYIVVDKLHRCGLGIREIVAELDRDINVSSERSSGYDSYSFRAVNSTDNVKLEFADPKDEQRFTEMGFRRYGLATEEDISERLKASIDKEYQSFKTINKSEPLFAGCNVRYSDEESSFPATIKLSSDVDDEEDDSVFFYCDSIEDLKSLTTKGAEDFTITEFITFTNAL